MEHDQLAGLRRRAGWVEVERDRDRPRHESQAPGGHQAANAEQPQSALANGSVQSWLLRARGTLPPTIRGIAYRSATSCSSIRRGGARTGNYIAGPGGQFRLCRRPLDKFLQRTKIAAPRGAEAGGATIAWPPCQRGEGSVTRDASKVPTQDLARVDRSQPRSFQADSRNQSSTARDLAIRAALPV
jgi:hypothetical protein